MIGENTVKLGGDTNQAGKGLQGEDHILHLREETVQTVIHQASESPIESYPCPVSNKVSAVDKISDCEPGGPKYNSWPG